MMIPYPQSIADIIYLYVGPTYIKLDLADADVYLFKNAFRQDHSNTINNEVTWMDFMVTVYGKEFLQPRKSFYMGDNRKSYYYAGHNRLPVPWTNNMIHIRDTVSWGAREIKEVHKDFNAVLGNLYRDGKDYIGWHSDDERDLNNSSFIGSVSFGATRDFVLKHKRTGEKLKIPLSNGDLLFMGDNCQTNYKHTVPKRLRVFEPRINLTFRCVKI